MDEASPDTNFGGGGDLFIRSQGSIAGDGDRRLYASFDLGQLPADAAEILTATFRLVPTDTDGSRTLRAHAVTGSWTEAGITWNSQPATGEDLGTEPNENNPQSWEVTIQAQVVFPNGRLEVRVMDDDEGSALSPTQTYGSREGSGTEPELVVTFKREGAGDLSSAVTVSKNQFSDLSSSVTPRVDGKRFQGFRAMQPIDGIDGDPIHPSSIAYDGDRGILWVTDSIDIKVHRVNLDGTTDQTHDLPFPGSSGLGVAYDGTALWLTLESGGELQRWSIQADGITHEETIEADAGDEVAWDGTNLWTVDTFPGTIRKHDTDGSVLRTETLDDVEGIAFADGIADPFLLEDAGDDPQIVQRDVSDFSELDRWDSAYRRGVASITLEQRDPEAGAWVVAWQDDELLRFSPLTLPSSVTVGNLIGNGDLDAQVQPGNIPASTDLSSQVKPGTGDDADLASTLTPQPSEHFDLGSTVQPSNVADISDLTSTIQPGTNEISDQGRATGSVAPTIIVDSDDFAEISAEIGSEITHTHDGSTSSLRRVIQLVDTQTAKTFPREATSEHGRGKTHAELGRGDAVLYAKQGDTFHPGDTVTYDALTWEVVGLLGWELVGDERIYQEVGLRRVSITFQARALGTVQLSNAEDLQAEVTVNVP